MTTARAPRRHAGALAGAATARATARPGRRPSPRPTPRQGAHGAAQPSLPLTTAAPAVERAELAVVPTAHRKKRWRVAGVLAGFLLFGVLLGLAVFHTMLVQGQLRLDQLDRTIATAQTHQSELRLQVAQLGAPNRILQEAQARGMVQPDNPKYLAAVVPGTAVPPPPTTKAPAKKAAAPTTTAAPATAPTTSLAAGSRR